MRFNHQQARSCHSTHTGTVPGCYLSEDSTAYVCACLAWSSCKVFGMNAYLIDFSHTQIIKYQSNKKSENGTLSGISLPSSVSFYKRHFPFFLYFAFLFFLWNAVLKEVVSAFASICSQQDSVKHYTALR